jgi:Cytochrome bd terminal oxidase subunit I
LGWHSQPSNFQVDALPVTIMDPVILSRLQFALTASFHSIYPPISMGLGVLLVWFGWKYVRNKDPIWRQAEKARQLFVRFAKAMLRADQNVTETESVVLLNFEDVLYASPRGD